MWAKIDERMKVVTFVLVLGTLVWTLWSVEAFARSLYLEHRDPSGGVSVFVGDIAWSMLPTLFVPQA
jgi:hypothetical protein